MDQHMCLLEAATNNEKSVSASGIIVSAEHGAVLSHISLITPLLSSEQVQDLHHNGHLKHNDTSTITVRLILEKKSEFPNKSILISRKNACDIPFEDVTTSDWNVNIEKSQEKIYETRVGEIFLTWESERLSRTFNEIMPKTQGWTFADPEKSKNKDHTEEVEQIYDLLPFFVLIKAKSRLPEPSVPLDILSPLNLRIGQDVGIVGTPFGTLCPAVFANSFSQGVLSNFAGYQRELILTDARAIPGTEGGIVFVKGGDDCKRMAIGMLIAPLCWKSCEWVGLALACSLHEILRSLTSQDMDHLPWQLRYKLQKFSSSLAFSFVQDRPLDMKESDVPMFKESVLVRAGSNWGTGFYVDKAAGLLLTCSHVVLRRDKVNVVQTYPSKSTLEARVIYSTPVGHIFDIAVLRIINGKSQFALSRSKPNLRIGRPTEGEMVYAIGHACFDESSVCRASVTRGVISKIAFSKNMPIMIQSTCAVHAGASGGPLVSEKGDVVAMLTCNARDAVSGSSFPHISMGIPMAAVWPIIKQYIKTEDIEVLNKLHISDTRSKAVWNLKNDVPGIQSRL